MKFKGSKNRPVQGIPPPKDDILGKSEAAARQASEKVKDVSRGDLRWALHRVSQAERDRVLALIPDNPKLEDRDRRLAHDVFDKDVDLHELMGKYNISTIHGVKTAVGSILDNLVREPAAQAVAKGFLDFDSSIPKMEPTEVRDKLRTIEPVQVSEIIEAVPAHVWKDRSVISEHKRIVLTYFERSDWSVREFVQEYNIRYPDSDLKDRKADQTIKRMLARISREPALREKLYEWSGTPVSQAPQPVAEPTAPPETEPIASVPPMELVETQGKTEQAPPQPEPAELVDTQEELVDTQEELADTQDKPKETISPQLPDTISVQAPASKPKKTGTEVDLTVPVADIGSFDDLSGALHKFGNKFSQNLKKILKAAGFMHTRDLKDALNALPSTRKTGDYMDAVNLDINHIGHRIPVALAFVRTQPAETLIKLMDHLEESPLQFMDNQINFNDVPRIAFYIAVAGQMASNPDLAASDASIKDRSRDVVNQYDQLLPDLKISESARIIFDKTMGSYKQIAENSTIKNLE